MPPGEGEGRAEGLIEEILQAAPSEVPPSESSELLTFLFADIRGYTSFTQRRGDEAAAKLTGKFASIVRDLVVEYGGTVFELRGDEAMCVFASPRQSLRLAVALQQRFVEETAADPTLPMTVGIGVDAGEAVRGVDGYRGGALNLAARLCSKANAGDVLASNEVSHLARHIEGIRYLVQDSVELKGISDPVRPVRVLPDSEDPAQQIAALIAAAGPSTPTPGAVPWLPGRLGRLPGRQLGATVAVVLLAVAGTVVGVAAPGSGGGSTVLGENAVGIFNPANGHLTARLSVQNDPSAATSGLGAVWVANTNSDSVSRIDAATHQIATVAVGHAPSAIVTGFDSVWVTDSGDSTVARLDPTNPANPQYINVGADPGGIAVGDGSVWVTDTGDGTVDRIDPSKNAVVQTIDVGDNPTGVVVAGKDVWVADAGSNAVSRISGNGNRFTAVATIPVGNDPESLAVAGGELWVTNNLSGTLSRISLAGASSVAGTLTVGSYPTRLAVVGDRLWVASQGDEQVQEIEPGDTPRVVRSIPLGVIPGGITASGGRLWVSGTVDPALHRGGTLTMTGPDPGPADPIGGGDPATFLLTSVYDGLVTYRHVTGADSEAVVPDLATAIPAPTDNGLTYTFQLRSGIRFSNGKLVTVDDVKRGIERALTAQGVLNQVIRGARHCAPASCDISGIAVDPTSRTVTISLTHPFSGFLAELAALIYAVPANTPLALQSKPILGTGPYRISRYDEHHIVVLTRNPYFRVWSSAAQPEGFPDRIVYHVEGGSTNPVRQARRAVSDVAAGRSDWADARFAGEPLGELQATFGDRLIATPQLATHGIFLNTRVAPFDSLLARRAVALAIDRGAVAADWPTPATVTCQVLPPDYPGYRPYCPFTLRRSTTGTWSEPATSRAQQMVRRSGTENAHVTVWSLPAQAKTMADVVQAMDAIGYRARLKVITNPYLNYFALVSDSRNRAQAGFFGYLGPTVDPSSYFAGIWRCHDFIKNNPANFNAAEFCSPALDRLVARGIALSTTSSTAADQLWAAVDRKLVDSAAYIPLVDTSLLDVISTRVHNYQNNPVIGVLYDQMWVR